LAAGSFWESGVDVVEKGLQDVPKRQREEEEEAWQKEVLETLECLKGVAVADGYV